MNRLRTFTIATCALLMTLTACDRPASGPQPAPGGPAPAPAPAAAAASTEEAKPAESVTPAPPSAGEQAALEKFVSENAPAAATGALPPGHPPIEGAAPAQPAAGLPSGHPPVAGVSTELKFDAPEGWASTPPRSAMRKAQYMLPKAEGDAEDAELVVFYFGPGEGGGVEDNLARWRGMFTTPDGQPLPADAMTREHFDANGLKVTMMDVAGRYAPSAMPGMPATGPKDDFRMLAAVVETPGGPWFFRAVGPQKTMAAHRDAFKQFLMSARQ